MTKKIIAMVLVVALMAVALTSCATKLSGTYSGEIGLGSLAGAKASYKFSGSKVTLTVTTTLLGAQSSTRHDTTYEITKADDGTESIKLTFGDADASSYSGSFSFAQNKDAGTISIGGVTYTKQ